MKPYFVACMHSVLYGLSPLPPKEGKSKGERGMFYLEVFFLDLVGESLYIKSVLGRVWSRLLAPSFFFCSFCI